MLEEELFLIGAANNPSALPPGPIKAKRLAELPLILPSRPHGLRLLIDQVLSGAGISVGPYRATSKTPHIVADE